MRPSQARYERSTSGTELVVRAQAAPHLVPECALLAERDIRLDADEEHALDPRRSGRQSGELRGDGGVPPPFREGKCIPEQVPAGREVVMDERLGDTGLVGDARHPKSVGALAHDHTTGRLQDPDGAIGCGWGGCFDHHVALS